MPKLSLLKNTDTRYVWLEGVRHYASTDNKIILPGTTSVLKSTEDNNDGDSYGLRTWKERQIAEFGIEGAKEQEQLTFARGTTLHKAIELYLLGVPYNDMFWDTVKESLAPKDQAIELGKQFWESVVDFLDSIEEVFGLELSFLNEYWGYAGSVDCIARVKGWDYPVLLDWKTSNKPKGAKKWATAKDWKKSSGLRTYPLQAAAYAGAINRIYRDKIRLDEALIVVALIDQPCQLFHLDKEKMSQSWSEWLIRLNQFRNQVEF